MATIRVTKLDAARRQLQTAIEIWFRDGDPVSIHTLAYAAHEIIHRLYRRKGLKGLFFDSGVFVEEARGRALKVIKEWPNFFKHAERDSDPDGFVDFNPEANLIFFSACIAGLDGIGVKRGDLEDALVMYLYARHPEYFKEEQRTDTAPAAVTKEIRRLKKSEFLDLFLKAKAKRRRRERVKR